MPDSDLDQVTKNTGMEDEHKVVEEEDGVDDREEDEPEPDEDIDLLIHDIDREHTKSIKCLNSSRKSIFVINTFCHFWKHS